MSFLKEAHADADALVRDALAGGFRPTILGEFASKKEARSGRFPPPYVTRAAAAREALRAVRRELKRGARSDDVALAEASSDDDDESSSSSGDDNNAEEEVVPSRAPF